MAAASFDPHSPGARRLARDWVPHLERWEMRVGVGHFYVEDDGTVAQAGDVVEVGAPHGAQLVDRGYKLVSVRRVKASD